MDKLTLSGVALRVSQYFRDFLETDFKRSRAPRRQVVTTTDSGFRAGMRASHFPALERDLWAQLGRKTETGMTLQIRPGRYTRPISPALASIIREQVNAVPDSAILTIREQVVRKAELSMALGTDDPEAWIGKQLDDLEAAAGEHIVDPLIAHLDGPLRNQAYWVMDTLHSVRAELLALVVSPLATVLPDALAKALATRSIEPVQEAVDGFLMPDAVRDGLRTFFEGFVAADGYTDFRDLETYVSTGDGLQLYLYVGTLRHRDNTYPLFFLPVNVSRSGDGGTYELEIVPHLYAHRAAIDYVAQELAAAMGRPFDSPIKDRLTYVAPELTVFETARPLFNRIAHALDLGGQVELGHAGGQAKTASVTLSSALYLAAFDRADEALLNDYEEIIDQFKRGGSQVVNLFEGLVEGVLTGNTPSIRADIERDWDALPLVDRVVFDSPIPMNEEQRKVLMAVRNPNGKIVVVEGPPGTGKSHTITAIAADCAFNQRTCLVLSDKSEALDVVVDKLTEAMSRVRHDPHFPNPILRLGRESANFRKLTANAAVTQVAQYAAATRANRSRIEAEREGMSVELKQAIDQTVELYGKVELTELKHMHECEAQLLERAPEVLAQLQAVEDEALIAELAPIEPVLGDIQSYLAGIFAAGVADAAALRSRVRLDMVLHRFAAERRPRGWDLFESLTPAQVRQLQGWLVEFRQLRMPVLGYLLRGGQVRALEAQLNSMAPTRPLLLRERADDLEALVASANALRIKLEHEQLGGAFEDASRRLARGAATPETAPLASTLIALFDRIAPSIVDALMAPPAAAELWPMAARFLRSWLHTRSAFVKAPQFDYVGTKTRLEQLNTSVMNAHIDNRLVEFMDNHRADARALAKVITARQKFPEDKFAAVRDSFPVIVAGIREFGEYMPLLPDLFDVVVIDEASQVSVAQALPALLRARKVVVLGDAKQFSNVKSSNASIAINERYRADLVNYFRREVSDQADALARLSMFDVKRSVLEFCNLGASYSIMLRKHFRSFAELIGYSSRTFYDGQLQAIKIRGVPLDQVVRFEQVDVGDAKVTRGVNHAEVEHILQHLLELLDQESPPTVGIITPFREQQTLLTKRLFGHARGRDFEDRLKLKVMTFDSCQGEERLLIIYSMVATPGNNALNYVFPVALDNASESVEDKLKVQRLNVGFSRAQERVLFVHSMPIEEIPGAIGQALAYYAGVLEREEVDEDQVDSNSPMETKVLGWLMQAPFYQSNQDRIEVIPQFPVGDYLRQLDPTYQHPAWRVDFLVRAATDRGPVNIVLEYDGFEYHFQRGREVHVGNYTRYMLPQDMERQLTLESYGYRFIRINRFNLGADPVQTLSARLEQMMKQLGMSPVPATVAELQNQAAALANRDAKTCMTCRRIKPHAEFFRQSLGGGAGGYGRKCNSCDAKRA